MNINNYRRVLLEGVGFIVFHMSVNKPTPIHLRIGLERSLNDWVESGFKCQDPNCIYCAEFPTDNDEYFLKHRLRQYNGLRKAARYEGDRPK